MVGVHDDFAIEVARGTPGRLDQRGPRTQVALLVRVEDGDQRDLRDVEALAQQVDADEAVELAEAQITDEGDAVEGVDVRVQVAHAQPELLVVLGQVFRHPLGERRDQHSLLAIGARSDLVQQVVHLIARRPHGDLGIREAGGTNHLLGHGVVGQPHLVVAGRRRDVHRLLHEPCELLESQRSIVERRRETEAVLDERLLARAVAVVHAADLRDGHVALVDDHQRVGRQIFDQHRRRLARPAPGEMPRVVLDAVAVAELAEHLEVEQRALLETLRLEQTVTRLEEGQALAELFLDRDHRTVELLRRRDVVAGGVYADVGQSLEHRALERIDAVDRLHDVAPQLDAQRVRLLVGGKDLDHVAAHAKGAAMEIVVVALVLDGDQSPHDLVAVDRLPFPQREVHLLVGLGRADAVDARHGGDHHHVAALEQRARGRVTHPVDLVVDERVLLDVRVRLRDVCLGLVVVVVRDEVFDGVVGEERLELAEELGGERLVGRQHEGGPTDVRDEVGHRVRLAGPRHPAQHGVAAASADEAREIRDGARLVSARLVLGGQPEGGAPGR